jgi:hypothetical protein
MSTKPVFNVHTNKYRSSGSSSPTPDEEDYSSGDERYRSIRTFTYVRTASLPPVPSKKEYFEADFARHCETCDMCKYDHSQSPPTGSKSVYLDPCPEEAKSQKKKQNYEE